jgi:hypothetical protein
MSLKTKKRVGKFAKTAGIILFAILLFTNIKIALNNDAEMNSGDVSMLGVEMKLFEPTYAFEVTFDDCSAICQTTYLRFCTYMVGYGDCPGKPRW